MTKRSRSNVADPGPDLSSLLPAYHRSLLAENLAPTTIAIYRHTAQAFTGYLCEKHERASVLLIVRGDIEEYLARMNEAGKAANTLETHYRALRKLFAWLLEEGELKASPLTQVKHPRVPEHLAPVLTDGQLAALLKACEGQGFIARRDMAMVRMLLDTGMRRAELAGLKLGSLDLERSTATVLGKGSRVRICPFGRKAAMALDRYLRLRARHKDAPATDALWLGYKGALSGPSVNVILNRLTRTAGIAHIHPHLFRHTVAHKLLARGDQEGELMQLLGWRSREMLNRYGASVAAERARDNYRSKPSPGDLL